MLTLKLNICPSCLSIERQNYLFLRKRYLSRLTVNSVVQKYPQLISILLKILTRLKR